MGKCIIVTGMHRSATSLLAKALHDQPNIWWPCLRQHVGGIDPHQPHGYWECRAAMVLSQKIFAMTNSSWQKPASEEAIIEAGNEIREHITHKLKVIRRNQKMWGFKDPRLCLTLPALYPSLREIGDEIHLVAIFRDTGKVCESMRKRNPQLSEEEATALIKEYNRRLVKWLSIYT